MKLTENAPFRERKGGVYTFLFTAFFGLICIAHCKYGIYNFAHIFLTAYKLALKYQL